jgi:hypothetical protein
VWDESVTHKERASPGTATAELLGKERESGSRRREALLWLTFYFVSDRFLARRSTHCPDDGGSTDLWNVGKLLPVNSPLRPRRQPFLHLRPCEPEIVLTYVCLSVGVCVTTAWEPQNGFSWNYHGEVLQKCGDTFRCSNPTTVINTLHEDASSFLPPAQVWPIELLMGPERSWCGVTSHRSTQVVQTWRCGAVNILYAEWTFVLDKVNFVLCHLINRRLWVSGMLLHLRTS